MGHRNAFRRLWQDRCQVYLREPVVDPETSLTKQVEKALYAREQPCRLSFTNLATADGAPAAAVAQSVTLFADNVLEIPAGCKIVVTRQGRRAAYAQSGAAAVYTHHQEVPLALFERWA